MGLAHANWANTPDDPYGDFTCAMGRCVGGCWAMALGGVGCMPCMTVGQQELSG